MYQRVENSFAQPVIDGRALKVNPIITILTVLVDASLLGVVGALLAIPIAAAIQILLRDWWAHRPAPDVTETYAPAPNGSTAEPSGCSVARWTPPTTPWPLPDEDAG